MAKDPTIPIMARLTCTIMEWLGFNMGVVAFIKATIDDKITMPTKYHNGLKPPINTVKNTHNNMYHAIDSEIIR